MPLIQIPYLILAVAAGVMIVYTLIKPYLDIIYLIYKFIQAELIIRRIVK
jgi:hypothetical protein